MASFKTAVAAQQSFIFTFHPENSVNPVTLEKLQSTVEESGGHVQYIQLKCSEAAVLERLDHPGRAQFGKLQDKALYQSLAAGGSFDFPILPADLVIDTESTTPDAAALTIKNRLSL